MRWLLVLLAAMGRAYAGDYEDVAIASVSESVFDPEGGGASSTVYATGYMTYGGHASCCGFKPRYPDGWYKAKSVAELQSVFDGAAMAAAYPQQRDPKGHGEASVELADGTKVNVSFGGTASITWEPSKAPPAGAKTLVVGHRLKDAKVRDVLYYSDAARAKGLSRDQAVVLLRVLASYPANSPFTAACLAHLAPEHDDLVSAALATPELALAAITAYAGAAGKPHVADIVAAAKASTQALSAGARTLVAIGTKDALAALRDTVLPALAAGDPSATDAERATARVAALPVLDELAKGKSVPADGSKALADDLAGLAAFVAGELARKPANALLAARVVDILGSRTALPKSIDQTALATYTRAGIASSDPHVRAAALRIALALATDPLPAGLLDAVRRFVHDKDADVAQLADQFVSAHTTH